MDDKTTRELLESLHEAQQSGDMEAALPISEELRRRIPDGAIFQLARPNTVYLSGWIYPLLDWEDIEN